MIVPPSEWGNRVVDEMSNEISIQIEEVRDKVRASLERANELVCEARLALRQQEERDPYRPTRQSPN